MGRVVKIKIRGRGIDADAPKAEDLLDQVRDHLDIMRGVETAIAEDGQSAIEWRVVNVTKNTPINFELEAYPMAYAANIDNRAEAVVRYMAEGLTLLQQRPERPLYFDDKLVLKAEKIFERVANGLALSEIDFGDDLPRVVVTPAAAAGAVKNAQLVLTPIDRPYKELGTVEGFTQKAECDGFNRSVLYIKHRLSGESVKCILAGNALSKAEEHKLADVFRSRRVLVEGTINYRGLGRIKDVEASDIHFLRSSNELPRADDILDTDFTKGLRTEEYLERLRSGRLP